MRKIDKRSIEDILALTPMQEGMLFHYLKDPGSDFYFEQLSINVSGKIDRVLFTKAWNFVIEINEMLRTLFRWKDVKNPVQIVLKEHRLKLRFFNLSNKNNKEKKKLLEDIRVQDRKQRFNLAHVPFRVTLCKINETNYEIIISNHHILYDGWSTGIILKEFFSNYHDLACGREPVNPLKTKFRELIKWDGQDIDKEKREKFWRNYLEGFAAPTRLTIKSGRKGTNVSIPGSCRVRFGKDKKIKFERFIREYKLTLASLLYIAWGLLLRKYNDSNDVIFGTTVSGRSVKIKDMKNTVGLFINTLPLRLQCNSDETVIKLLNRIKKTVQIREEFEATPLVKIKEYGRIENNEELFDSIVVIENYPLEISLIQVKGQLTINSYSMFEMTHYDLTVAVSLTDEFGINFIYNDELFEQEVIERLSLHFNNILEDIISNPEREVRAIGILSPAEKRQLLFDFNSRETVYPSGKTIQQLFAEQVERTPDNIALVGTDSGARSTECSGETAYSPGEGAIHESHIGVVSLSYKQLDRGARLLARYMLKKGVLGNELVGIMVGRSLQMIIGILGILKTGSAYLPLNPQAPAARIKYILEDCCVKILLTTRSLLKEGGDTKEGMWLEVGLAPALDFLPCDSQPQGAPLPLHLAVAPAAALAYVIYTSGSTGKPKGVAVRHSNFCPLMHWGYKYLGLNSKDRVVQNLSYYFDWSVWEIFITLTKGASLHLVSDRILLDSEGYGQFMAGEHITALHITPTHFEALLSRPQGFMPTLKYLAIGAEKLSCELVDRACERVREDCRVFNMYGPTEATIMSAVLEIDKTAEGKYKSLSSVPIGEPIANIDLLVLDRDGHLCPLNTAGELYIAGDALASGYLNDVEKSSAVFVKNRWEKEGINGKYLYKTGDCVRWLSDGTIEFLGRSDHQVKIRGFRIELGEIENRLLSYEDMTEAVVIVIEDGKKEKHLCAYIVSRKNLIVPHLREYLSQELPSYMIPSYFMQVEKMPLIPGGKIDRKSLPAIEAKPYGEYFAPRDEIEKKLVEIWVEILNLDHRGMMHGSVGIRDNFFHMGGDSLKAIRISAKVHKELKVEVPLAEFFSKLTIETLAAYIRDKVKQDTYFSIKPAEKKEYYALSSAQKRMYILQQMDKNGIIYNIWDAVILEGSLERDSIEEIFRKLITRHESFRTSFELIDSDPMQRIHENVDFAVERLTGSGRAFINPLKHGKAPDFVLRFVRSFDLSKAPLLRVGLLRPAEEQHLLLVNMHHIISDGISIGILLREFMSLYAGEELPVLTIAYKDYSGWQKMVKEKHSLIKQQEYWLNRFEGELPTLDLPTDFARPAVQNFEGDTITFEIASDETAVLKAIVLEREITLYSVLFALFNIFLLKISGQEDIVVGTPVSGRRHAELENIVGMFVNTLALRNQPGGDKTFAEFLGEVGEKTLAAFENQDYPFEELVDNLNVSRDTGRSPLFDVMFVLRDINVQRVKNSGLKIIPCRYDSYISRFDLTLRVIESGDSLLFTFEYSTKLFKADTIERFIGYFKKVVSAVLENPGQKILEIEIISDEEKRQLLFDFSDTDYVTGYLWAKTIHRLFEEQASRNPGRIAVLGQSSRGGLRRCALTYGELDVKANLLAQLLRGKGVIADTVVAVMVEAGFEVIMAIIGILKAGGAYLPIDPIYPAVRNRFILEDSGVTLRITTKALAGKIEFKKEDIYLEQIDKYTADDTKFMNISGDSNGETGPPPIGREKICRRYGSIPSCDGIDTGNPALLAYVIYTSGTTGRPKGTLIEHRNVVRLVVNEKFQFDFSEKDIWTMFHSFCFDFSVWEMYGALLYGGRLILISGLAARDPGRFLEILIKEKVTVLNQTPSAFYNLAAEEFKQARTRLMLRYVIFGGEALSPSKLKEWQEKYRETKMINMFGITETTVHVTYKKIGRSEIAANISNIGKPIPTSSIYILDKYLRLLPRRVPGELYVGGEGLGRGYLNRIELTKEKFVENPYNPRDGLYRSGDLARFLENGELEYLGRIDQQVKIRGYRIELAEIEERLLDHEEVKEALVLLKANERGDKYLCAYIVPQSANSPIFSDTLKLSGLRKHLSRGLPDYMVPTYFVPLEKLPLTPNGKIDRDALPGPEGLSLAGAGEYAVPRSAVEKKLVEVWQQVLGRNVIGINDNFFEIGGDSIKTIQIVSRMAKAGYKVDMKEIFQYPRIAELALSVKKVEHIADQSPVTGMIPLTPIQKWFFSNKLFDRHHFNQAVMLSLPEGFAEEGIKQVFSKLQEHHDALRITLKAGNGNIVQVNHGLDFPLSLQVFDYRERKEAGTAVEAAANRIQASIDLEKGPLMKLALFRLFAGDRLLIVIHHLVIDGVSWRILFEDIETLYQQYKEGEPLVLPLKTGSYKLWSDKLSSFANSDPFLKQKKYWLDLESTHVPPIKRDFAEEINDVKNKETLSFSLSEEETRLLLTQANEAFGTEVNDLLLTALGLAFKETSGLRSLLIALEGHGREEILKDVDISRTLGWFTSIYPVILDFSYEKNLSRQIKEVKETLHTVPDKGVGYGILRFLTAREHRKEIDFRLAPSISFNYLGQFDADIEQVSFKIADEPTGSTSSLAGQRLFELEVIAIVRDKKLLVSIDYNRKQYKTETMRDLWESYRSQLGRVIRYCSGRESKELTPSDVKNSELSIENLDRLQKQYLIEDIYTCTPLQEGMLFHALYDSCSSAHFVQVSYRLLGELNPAIVERSLSELLKRHHILRTIFAHEGLQRPLQVIQKEWPVNFRYEDIRHLGEGDAAEKGRIIEEFKEKDRQRSFALSKGVLIRLAVIRVEDREYQFIWSFHHILMDGWCTVILNAEFFEIYKALFRDKTCDLPAVTPYKTYIRWLENQDYVSAKRYWRSLLAGYSQAVGIPRKKTSAGSSREYKREEFSFVLDCEQTGGLDKLAAENRVTLSIVFQTIWGVLLAKYNNTRDVVFGIVVSGRPAEIPGIESMIGLFINTIPIRLGFEVGTTFSQLLLLVQEQAVNSEPYHYFSLAEIQSGSDLKQDLMDHFLTFLNYPEVEQIAGVINQDKEKGLNFEISQLETVERSNYNLDVLIYFTEQLTIKLRYNTNVYDSNFMRRLALHIREVVDQVTGNWHINIEDIVISHDRMAASPNFPLGDDGDFSL